MDRVSNAISCFDFMKERKKVKEGRETKPT